MDTKKLTDYCNPQSFGSKMRRRRMVPLVGLIRNLYRKNGKVNILDVGGREVYWHSLPERFLKDHNVKITILNLPCEPIGEDCEEFKYEVGDACDLAQYQDNSFDIVHSNSVIEHVGGWEKIKSFADEVKRVAPNMFVQTPYFWFPIEPHFIKLGHHWLPKPLRLSRWLKSNMGSRGSAGNLDDAMRNIDDEPYLLDMRMFKFLFPDCRIIRERFLCFTKSMVAFRD